MKAILLALLLLASPTLAAEAELPGLAALSADLDRQADEHADTCQVVVDDRDKDHAYYIVHADCRKTKYRCFFAVNGENLDPQSGMPETALIGCELKPVDI